MDQGLQPAPRGCPSRPRPQEAGRGSDKVGPGRSWASTAGVTQCPDPWPCPTDDRVTEGKHKLSDEEADMLISGLLEFQIR